MPLGSFSGGFSSTAGYVPGNEAQVRRQERRSTHLADHFQRALLVFIRVTYEVVRRLFKQAFRLRFRAFETAAFRSFCLSNESVTASVPPPGAGQNARKQFDCENSLHQLFSLVK